MKILVVLFAVSAVIGEELQCDLLSAKFALEDLNTIADTTHKQLVGTWLSEGCEIRSGPQYLLRSYVFREDGTYKLIQHHYWDSSCSMPKFTIASVGLLRLSRNLVYNPDAASGFVRSINISLVPHGSDAAEDLRRIAIENCPDLHWHQWKKYEQYLLYHDTMMEKDNFSYLGLPRELIRLTCLGNLKFTLNELKFIKIQIRPMYDTISENPTAKFHRLELLLGDTISSEQDNSQSVPTSFQPPLLKWTSEYKISAHGKQYKIKNSCAICANLHKNEATPPHLLKKPELPPYIEGNWISTRCEIRSMGFYLTRSFFFATTTQLTICIGEHKFYLDPFCAVPKFSLNTVGDFRLLTKNVIQPDATDLDLNIRQASLTIFDRKMSEEMSKSGACNLNVWEVDIPYDIKHNYRCSELNLIVPSTQFDIAKLDINYEGSSLLYLGLMDPHTFSRIAQNRPTSYSEPLIKCTPANGRKNNWDNLLASEMYFNSCRSKNKLSLFLSVLIVSILWLA